MSTKRTTLTVIISVIMKKVGILFLLTILFSLTVSARTVTLTWDPNSEPDLSHYIVYWGTTTRNYTMNSGNIGLVTTHTLTIPDTGQYFFAVTAVDTAGLESDYSNEVFTENNTVNLPPTANAGLDQGVMSGSVATLDGSGTDPNGDTLSYSWTQIGGTTVTLSSKTVAKPTFTAPTLTTQNNIVLTFQLTVKDPAGLQATDNCTVTVINPNLGVSPAAPSNIRTK